MTMRRRIVWTGLFLSRTTTSSSSIVSLSLEKTNMTGVTEFFLLGFQVGHIIRILIFSLLLVIYCFTIFMNLLIMVLVSSSRNLRTPMYFFISQLSINDILLSTDVAPNMLHVLLHYRAGITFIGCMTQLYFFGVSEAAECLLLTVMSYDRYVAIVNPLRYASIMTRTYCVVLVITSWLVAFCILLFTIITILKLNFCGPNIVDHFFCDFVPILGLTCSDTFNVQIETSFFSIPLIFFPIIIIIFSYSKIIVTILRIPSRTGRQKAFSTCSSHLIVVSMFYGTLFSVYVVPPRGQSPTMSKIPSLLYTVCTPLINPIIYSLKNKEIMKALHVMFRRHICQDKDSDMSRS